MLDTWQKTSSCVIVPGQPLQLRRDSNPQPPDSKSDTLSIAPRSCVCVEEQGFEPWAFRMQSGRSATELHPQICIGRGRGTVAAREVAALAHEVRDDAVEGGALEVERLARAARACGGTYRRHAFINDRYAIRTRNLQDWNLTRYRCANRSAAKRRGDAAAVRPRTSERRTCGT